MQRTKKFKKICLLAVMMLLIVAMLAACNDKVDPEENGGGSCDITTSYTAPTPSEITAEEVKTVIVPLLKEHSDELGVTSEEIDESLEGQDEGIDIIVTRLLRPSGITKEMLEEAMEKIKPLIEGYVMPIYQKTANANEGKGIVDPEAFVNDIVNTYFTASDIRYLENTLISIINIFPVNSLLTLAANTIDVIVQDIGKNDEISIFESTFTERQVVEILESNNVDVSLWKDANKNPTFDMLKTLILSDETAYTVSSFFSAFASALSYSEAEQRTLLGIGLDIGFALAVTEDGGEALLGGEIVSYNEMAKAVRIVGNIINSGLNGLADKEAFHNCADSLVSKTLALSGEEYEAYMVRAFTYPEFFALVGNLCAGLTGEQVSKLYLYYNDVEREKNSEIKNIKIGRFIAAVVNFVGDEYGKLSLYTINFIGNACLFRQVPEEVAGLAVKLIAKVDGRDADSLSDAECKELYTMIENVVSKKDEANFYIYGSNKIILKADATKEEIIAAIGDGYSYEDEQGNTFPLSELTFTVKSIDGVGMLVITGDKISAYYQPVSIIDDTFQSYMSSSYNYPMYAFAALSESTDEEALIEALHSGYSYYGNSIELRNISNNRIYLYNPVTFKAIQPEFSREDAVISVTGYDTTKQGEHAATISYETAYGTFQTVLFYYVYDNDNPEMTGIYADTFNYYISVGEDEEALELRVSPCYNYGKYYSYSDPIEDGYTVEGFDSSKPGHYTAKVVYGEFSAKVYYVVEEDE